MAIKETVSTVTTCDYCQKEICGDRANKFKLCTGSVGQGTDQHQCFMEITMKGTIPYCTVDADICKKCAAKILRTVAELYET